MTKERKNILTEARFEKEKLMYSSIICLVNGAGGECSEF